MHYETIIRNGRVFDGLGASNLADVGIKDGRIAALSPALEATADVTLDAAGLWVAPGFIDIHTHYDLEVEIAPSLAESVRHGVTTIVMGGCSLSVTFGEPEDLAHIFSRVETLPLELISSWLKTAHAWQSPAKYFDHFCNLPLGPNVACMLGHSALRVKVMGLERSLNASASPAEIEAMRILAEEALDAGCIGISVDMVHWHKVSGAFAGRALPSHHAAYPEYAMLADVCRSRDAVFQVTPNPENALSFLNILRLSPGVWRAPLRSTILSALDMDGMPHLWRLFPIILFICNRLLGCNIRFQTLAEPFTIYSDGYLTPLFEEFSAGVRLNNCKSREERQTLWRDPSFREEFIKSWSSGWPRTFHRDFKRMTIVSAPDSELNGKTIDQAAKDAGAKQLEYFMTLLEKYDDELRWVACSANMRAHIRHKLMSHPHIFPGFSDAGAHARNLAFFDNSLSVLRQAVSTGFITPEVAVARVTAEPAHWFNLDSGCLKIGAKADITILDPTKLRQPIPPATTIADPILAGAARMVKHDPDPAVCHVFIHGVEVVSHGNSLPALGQQKLGEVLFQQNPARSKQETLARHRNRISESVTLSNTQNYWDIFLLKHQHSSNVALHCVAFAVMYAIPLLAWAYGNIWILAFMPLSQAIGLIGHYIFEPTPVDQRDAIFSWRAFISLHRMFFLVITSRYSQELNRVRKYLATA
ncbi:MAG: amidohydrolase family protein [Burkholderiales bacterium]|jgi:N-acyl-D-aspartate/D-glutamate deacylase|nr:amidohydrolase family protein [Burkholderiales bacterium]